ncbi:MAG TPA: hypothetical protein VIS06_01875 [Mycobacteriales bacterium]
MTDEFGWLTDPFLDQHDPVGSDALADHVTDDVADDMAGHPDGGRYGPVWPHHLPSDPPSDLLSDDPPSDDPSVDHAATDRWQMAGPDWSTDSADDVEHRFEGVASPRESMFQPHPTGIAVGGAVDAGDFGFDSGPESSVGMDVSLFPARLELDVVPSDGHDWVDVDLLGDPAAGSLTAGWFDPPQELLADLHRLDGGDGTPSWQAVTESDDPAVRALGLRWQRG